MPVPQLLSLALHLRAFATESGKDASHTHAGPDFIKYLDRSKNMIIGLNIAECPDDATFILADQPRDIVLRHRSSIFFTNLTDAGLIQMTEKGRGLERKKFKIAPATDPAWDHFRGAEGGEGPEEEEEEEEGEEAEEEEEEGERAVEMGEEAKEEEGERAEEGEAKEDEGPQRQKRQVSEMDPDEEEFRTKKRVRLEALRKRQAAELQLFKGEQALELQRERLALEREQLTMQRLKLSKESNHREGQKSAPPSGEAMQAEYERQQDEVEAIRREVLAREEERQQKKRDEAAAREESKRQEEEDRRLQQDGDKAQKETCETVLETDEEGEDEKRTADLHQLQQKEAAVSETVRRLRHENLTHQRQQQLDEAIREQCELLRQLEATASKDGQRLKKKADKIVPGQEQQRVEMKRQMEALEQQKVEMEHETERLLKMVEEDTARQEQKLHAEEAAQLREARAGRRSNPLYATNGKDILITSFFGDEKIRRMISARSVGELRQAYKALRSRELLIYHPDLQTNESRDDMAAMIAGHKMLNTMFTVQADERLTFNLIIFKQTYDLN